MLRKLRALINWSNIPNPLNSPWDDDGEAGSSPSLSFGLPAASRRELLPGCTQDALVGDRSDGEDECDGLVLS